MIWTIGTVVLVIIGFFAIVTGSYAGYKALRIAEKYGKATVEERYVFEKDFSLVSSISWLIMLARIAAVPLFYWTVLSLIPLVPGAMCGYGVMQAGTPYSWMDLGVKLFTLYVYGYWLILDYINKKCKGAPLLGHLSGSFLFLLSFIYIDSALDVAFAWKVEPISVPCCRIAFPLESLISCPFCLVFGEMPLLIAVITFYAFSILFEFGAWLIQRYSKRYDEVKRVSSGIVHTFLKLGMYFAVLGSFMLVIQLALGPIAPRELWF